MILRKSNNEAMQESLSRSPRNSAAMLGLRVEGGKMTASGRTVAFIMRVKHGSIADVIGHLRPGDEVLEWNAIPLRNLSYDEVFEIIADCRDDPEVELMVARKITERDNYILTGEPKGTAYSPRTYDQSGGIVGGRGGGGRRAVMDFPVPSVINTPLHPQQQPAVPYVSGRIQLSFYYSHTEAQLAVTVIQAAELLPRPDQSYRNAYAKLYLLPNRR